jgi:hypothetical protein
MVLLVSGNPEGRLTNVWMPVFTLDSNLNTVLLSNLFRPAKRPMETILAVLLCHSLAGRPFGTVVIPPETEISALNFEKQEMLTNQRIL